MSEIQRYKMEFAPGSGGWIKQTARGELVLFTDHEAERAENLATIDFLNKELRSAVDALADAEARIEGLVHKEQGFDNADMEYGYGRGLAESIRALAALTQPQAERCPEDCDGFGRLIGDSDGPCPACSGLESDGGGAATAAEETVTVELSRELIERWDQGTLDAVTMEDYNARLDEIASAEHEIKTKLLAAIEAPGPYAKAFRVMFPVPEFPGIKNRQEDQA